MKGFIIYFIVFIITFIFCVNRQNHNPVEGPTTHLGSASKRSFVDLGGFEIQDQFIKELPNGVLKTKHLETHIEYFLNEKSVSYFVKGNKIYEKKLSDTLFANIFDLRNEMIIYNSLNSKALAVFFWPSLNVDKIIIYRYFDWYIFKAPEYEQTLEKESYYIFNSKSFKIKAFGILKEEKASIPYNKTQVYTESALKYDSIQQNLYLDLKTKFTYDVSPIDSTLNGPQKHIYMKRKNETKLENKIFNELLLFNFVEGTFENPSIAYEEEVKCYLGVSHKIYLEMLFDPMVIYNAK